MEVIQYIKGDAAHPQGEGNKIVAHICNDIGGWGKGFVMAISKKWKQPEEEYRTWFKNQEAFKLGEIQLVNVEADLWIANMIGQHKIKTQSNGVAAIRYEAVEKCLEKLVQEAQKLNASVHMPRIGCGLAGGKWEEVEKIILRTLSKNRIKVFIYDFE